MKSHPLEHRHHRRSIRLQGWDYSEARAYFVTICTQNHQCLLGDVVNDEMLLNECGGVVAQYWEWLRGQYLHLDLDAWIVMPNHVHGIIVIGEACRGGSRTAPTKGKPLGRLVGAFKTVSTKQINLMRGTPGAPVWQRNYYEHIIRNEEECNLIRKYIADNPLLWALDRENPQVSASARRGGSRTAPTDEVEAILYGSRKAHDIKPCQDVTA